MDTIVRWPAFLFVSMLMVFNLLPGRAHAEGDTQAFERSLVFFHSPEGVGTQEILERLQEVSERLKLPREIYDTSVEEHFQRLLRYEREREFPSWGHSVLLAGTHIAVGYKAVLDLLDGLYTGKYGLEDPLPPKMPDPQFASGEKYGSLMRLPPGGGNPKPRTDPLFPPFGSWTIVAGLAAGGVVLGMFLAARRPSVGNPSR